MPLSNTATLYGEITKAFHWLTAILIFTAFPLGLIANGLPFETDAQLARKILLFSVHKTLGVTIFFVALARILWAFGQIRPTPLHPGRTIETFAAETVHWMLYGALVLVPLSGWIYHAATAGFAPIWWPFGQGLPFVPRDPDLAEVLAALHQGLVRVLFVAVALHVAGAAKHALIDRDLTLGRMLPGRRADPGIGPRPRGRAPMTLAMLVYLAVLAAAAWVGLSRVETGDPRSAPVAAGADWVVETGRLAVTVDRNGAPLTGEIDGWAASIVFDPEAPGDIKGRVTVDIILDTIAFGADTSRVLGSEFLATDLYPFAAFTAALSELDPATGTYLADGMLTLRQTTAAVAFPFALTLSGATAGIDARITLDRRDFAIGTAIADPAELGFEVVVDIALTATRAPD